MSTVTRTSFVKRATLPILAICLFQSIASHAQTPNFARVLGEWKLPICETCWNIEFMKNGEWKEVGFGNPLTSKPKSSGNYIFTSNDEFTMSVHANGEIRSSKCTIRSSSEILCVSQRSGKEVTFARVR